MSKVKINAGESNIITPIRITSNYSIKIMYFYNKCLIYATKLLLPKVTKFTSHIHAAGGE